MEVYNSESSRNSNLLKKKRSKKTGKIILLIWILLVVLFAMLTAVMNNLTNKNPIFSTLNTVGIFIIVSIFCLLPVWFFLLAGKILKIVVISLVLIIVIPFIVLFPSQINGNSMAPSLNDDEYVFCVKSANIARGNIVIFDNPNGFGEYIARVVGLPGEKIMIREGMVFINGKKLNEPYLKSGLITKPESAIAEEEVVIPENKYAILGDNRDRSNDSRRYGFVDIESIHKKPFVVFWPAAKIRFIRTPIY